jgi:hypothetical protein
MATANDFNIFPLKQLVSDQFEEPDLFEISSVDM